MTIQSESWPAWFYGPEGQSELFQNHDEVPEGWADHPSKVEMGPAPIEEPEAVTEHSHVPPAYEELANENTHAQLISMIDSANEERDEEDQIEYAGNWS